MKNGEFAITIRRRAWWLWLLAALWLVAEIVFLQTGMASMRESEYRAAHISYAIAAVLGAADALASRGPGEPRANSTWHGAGI